MKPHLNGLHNSTLVIPSHFLKSFVVFYNILLGKADGDKAILISQMTNLIESIT